MSSPRPLTNPVPLRLEAAAIKRKALRQIVSTRMVQSALPREAAELFMENLRSLGLDALLPAISVHVHIDVAMLAEQSESRRSSEAIRTMVRRFLQAQAGTALVRTLFPSVPAPEIDAMRLDLGVPAPTVAEELSAEDQAYLRHIWTQLCAQTGDPAERYLALHERLPRYSLYALFSALNQSLGQVGGRR